MPERTLIRCDKCNCFKFEDTTCGSCIRLPFYRFASKIILAKPKSATFKFYQCKVCLNWEMGGPLKKVCFNCRVDYNREHERAKRKREKANRE